MTTDAQRQEADALVVKTITDQLSNLAEHMTHDGQTYDASLIYAAIEIIDGATGHKDQLRKPHAVVFRQTFIVDAIDHDEAKQEAFWRLQELQSPEELDWIEVNPEVDGE